MCKEKRYSNKTYSLKLVRESKPEYKVACSEDVFSYVKNVIVPLLWGKNVEVFGFIGLDTSNQIILVDFSQQGGVNESRVYIAEIAKKLLLSNSTQVILVHNHPSGNLKASGADVSITEKIKEALSYFDIRVLDHLITGEDYYLSFKETGLL